MICRKILMFRLALDIYMFVIEVQSTSIHNKEPDPGKKLEAEADISVSIEMVSTVTGLG